MSTSFAAAEALRVVLHEAQPVAMAEILLDMERARMTAEDLPWRLRAAMASPYSTNDLPPHRRTLSWREFGVECKERSLHLTADVIEPAKDLLHDARHEILMALSDPSLDSKAAMSAAHNAMLAVERRLEDDSDASESSADASELESES